MTIRPFRHDDVDDLIAMSTRMHEESAYSFLPFDSPKVAKLILAYVEYPETYGGFVAEAAGGLAGMIGGYVSDYFFCNEKIASDMVLFVEKKFRGTRTAFGLIRAFEQWASERGARELCMGVSTEVCTEGTGRLYEHMGMRCVGGLYKKTLAVKKPT
jgi:GNAT superfamily N-acetyltransferase